MNLCCDTCLFTDGRHHTDICDSANRRLPLLLLPLLRAVTTAAATAALVVLARDASEAPVLQMSVHQPSMISVVFTVASVVRPTLNTVTTLCAAIVAHSLVDSSTLLSVMLLTMT